MPKRDGDDYEVGYRKPPSQSRFKKGVSGNPRGRPRGSRNIRLLLVEELSNKIPISENGKRRIITKREGIVKQIVNRAIGGSDPAIRLVLELLYAIEDSQPCPRDHNDSPRVPIQLVQAFLKRVDAERARRKLEMGGPAASDGAE